MAVVAYINKFLDMQDITVCTLVVLQVMCVTIVNCINWECQNNLGHLYYTRASIFEMV